METAIKFKTGEIVIERIHPAQKLIVSDFIDNLYYCKAQEHRHRKNLVCFERDLMVATVR